MTLSQTASRLGIDNTAPVEVFRNLVRLCDSILEPLRNAISRPLTISSGYRCTALNAAIRGSKNSDHLRGCAADVTAPDMTADELLDKVRSLAPYVPLKQCIREYPPGGWVHVSCLPENDLLDFTPQFLVATLDKSGQTVYSKLEQA
jgi:uncharacterized protein YcbK (DUF882 family)